MLKITHLRTTSLVLAFTGATLFSCRQTGDQQKESAFIPNPQKVAKQEVTTLAIGASAPDFKLPGVDGKFYTLHDFEDAKVLVILFTCNHCPTAQAYEDRMIQFTKEYKDKGVSVVAIMPNSTAALLPEECGYTDMNDTLMR